MKRRILTIVRLLSDAFCSMADRTITGQISGSIDGPTLPRVPFLFQVGIVCKAAIYPVFSILLSKPIKLSKFEDDK